MLCYCRGLEKGGNWLLFFVSLAGAIMTKGPVGILLPVMVITMDCILDGRGGGFMKIGWGKGLLITGVLAAPWYVLICLKNPGLFHYFVFFQTIERFFSTVHGREGSPLYFVVVFLIGFLPWTPLLPVLIKKHLSLKRNGRKKAERLLTLWLIVPLIFFSFSGSKLPSYILPVFPASALLTGKMGRDLLKVPGRDGLPLRISCYLYLAGFVLLILSGLFFLTETAQVSAWARFDLSPLKGAVFILLLLATGGMMAAFHALKTRSFSIFFPTLILGSLLGYATLFASIAPIEPLVSPTTLFVKKIFEGFKPGDKIASYQCMLNGLAFYTGERIITVHQKRETLFEEDPDQLKRYVIQDKRGLKDLFEKGKTVYLVIKKRHLEEAGRVAGRPLYTLAQNNSFMLLTDKKIGGRVLN